MRSENAKEAQREKVQTQFLLVGNFCEVSIPSLSFEKCRKERKEEEAAAAAAAAVDVEGARAILPEGREQAASAAAELSAPAGES